MDGPPADAQTTYTAVANQWASQVQADRQSVALSRQVGARRERRRRTATMVAAIPRPTPAVHETVATPDERPALRLVPSEAAPAEGPATPTPCPLTPRQLEVVELISQGMTNAQIARTLVLTPGTVANHIEHILRRLDVPNRAAAVTWLARERPRLLNRSPQSSPEAPGQN